MTASSVAFGCYLFAALLFLVAAADSAHDPRVLPVGFFLSAVGLAVEAAADGRWRR